MRILPIVAALPLYTLFFVLLTTTTTTYTSIRVVDAFVPLSITTSSATRNTQNIQSQSQPLQPKTTAFAKATKATTTTDADASADAAEIVGRRITVTGDVNGGYIRTCIMNEASVFRKLIGTMSPPDSTSSTAEIYVEGKKKNVEGFIRWCKKASNKVGLSQRMDVQEVVEEEPTGLYDGFYVKTGLNSS